MSMDRQDREALWMILERNPRSEIDRLLDLYLDPDIRSDDAQVERIMRGEKDA